MKRIKLSYMSNTYLRILLAVLVLGCSQAQKPICTVNKLNTTGIQEGEAIVVLSEFSETKYFLRHHDERKIGKCISKALKKQNRKIEIFPADEFRRIFFTDPYLPKPYSTSEALGRIVANNEILKHIESLNIHYIVFANLVTWNSGPQPEPENLVTPNYEPPTYVGFYGQAYFSEYALLSGEVFDIKHKCESGQIVTKVLASWTNRGIDIGIPIPLYIGRGGTESEACKAFGEEVVKFLIGQDTNQ